MSFPEIQACLPLRVVAGTGQKGFRLQAPSKKKRITEPDGHETLKVWERTILNDYYIAIIEIGL
jgi:hypothetical protein